MEEALILIEKRREYDKNKKSKKKKKKVKKWKNYVYRK
jgi:DNA topoisomerase-1